MKNLTKIASLMLIFLSATVFNSCTKEGPAGPKGETGATGATGATGPDAISFDLYANFDASNSYYMTPIYSYGFETGDAVLVYFVDPAFTSSDWRIQIPFMWYNGGSTPYAYFWHQIASVSLAIHAQKPDNDIYTSAFTSYTVHKFNVMIIKKRAMIEYPGIELKDIGEIKRILRVQTITK